MPAHAAAAGDFCVLAMGKLGARELNLSSDIDVVYLYDSRNAADGAESARRLGELLTELLAGCFRVDLRLRPGGRSAPLVTSLDGALGFYQSLGQTWERAALLRARPVAGAVALGQRLIDELLRFVFRRYLDFETLRQLRAMKRRIEAELRSPALIERNIKLGYGGIRELEFIVHALALIYGGRDPRIRTEQTVDALERLGGHGYLPVERAQALVRAYLFLRDVEHKLQVTAALQTHTLPAEDRAIRVLAARMGFGKDSGAAARFIDALKRHRTLVAAQFRDTLAGGDDAAPRQRVSAAADAAWRAAVDPESALLYLDALGYSDPAESVAHLEFLARGPAHAPASPRRREFLDRLGPLLLDEMASLPDPDLALMNLASFMAAIGARTSFLALLEEHPSTRRVLLRLFASSRHLSTIFIRHPDMLDTLVRSDLVHLRRDTADLRRELGGILAACPDFESRLDALRAFRHQEFLRVAIADLGGSLELSDVEHELTALAETVLRAALDMARTEVAARQPAAAVLAMCAIAMGRLGAAEMSYNSDLDLIFVFDDAGGAASSGREVAARIVHKLIAILESRTAEGYAYKLDLRLRPSGNQGPVVTPLDGFIQYHQKSSAVWERQALIRGRVIAGDAGLGAKVEVARTRFVFGRGLRDAELAEIVAMRARMEREIGAENRSRLNLKQGPGGLVDVEFLTQILALRYGKDIVALRERATAPLIRALGESGVLARDEAELLEHDYRFLARLENRLRIESDQPAWAVPTDPASLTPLARRMGFDGADAARQLLDELEMRRARIRGLFERTVAAESTRGL
jgi:glutamate-ammonia-ligase adenylyltransferase